MGWLFGKKDDGLYRGDAPASSPGVDSAQPTAYQGATAAVPYDPRATGTANPYPTVSAAYPTSSAPYPASSAPYANPTPYPGAPSPDPNAGTPYPSVGVGGSGQPHSQPGSVPPRGQVFPGAATGMSGSGLPPELAAALRYAQNQQRVVTRTVNRSLFGFLVPMILIGGLVAVGFFVVGKVQNGIDNPFNSAPGDPFQGVVGTAGDVTLGDNSYHITITSATSQPTAAWAASYRLHQAVSW